MSDIGGKVDRQEEKNESNEADKVSRSDDEESGSGEPAQKKVKLTRMDRYLRGKESRKQGRKARKKRVQERRREAMEKGLEVVKPTRPMAVSMTDSACKTCVVIDCSYDHMMAFKDICKLAHQINHCYSSNRRLKAPVQLYVTGLGSAFKKEKEKNAEAGATGEDEDLKKLVLPDPNSTLARLKLISAENWDIYFKMEDYSSVFPSSSIVYLCAESPNDLPDSFGFATKVGEGADSAPVSSPLIECVSCKDSPAVPSKVSSGTVTPTSTADVEISSSTGSPSCFSTEDVYIIGGMVDHNRYSGFCYEQALKRGHRTARLPLARANVELSGRRVISLLHVFQALAMVVSGESDWASAFNAILPPRKIIDFNAAPANTT